MLQLVGETRYFDVAGSAGRTLGLSGSQPSIPEPVTRSSRR
jgi:hypothetical protein